MFVENQENLPFLDAQHSLFQGRNSEKYTLGELEGNE